MAQGLSARSRRAFNSSRSAVRRHNAAVKSSTTTPDSTAVTKAATLPFASLSWRCRAAYPAPAAGSASCPRARSSGSARVAIHSSSRAVTASSRR
jgi:hypothetical protein